MHDVLVREIITRMGKEGRRWLTYDEPCPRCGDRLQAVYAVVEKDVYLQCSDCGLGFSSPDVVGTGEGGEVFQDRETQGSARVATREDLILAGWDDSEFASA